MEIPLLTPAYFTGELIIQGIQGSTDASIAGAYELQWFINSYEEEFLRRLLGDDTYDDFAAGIVAGTSKWTALKDIIYTSKAYNQSSPVTYSDIDDDETFADVVPAGYLLEYVVFYNDSANAAVLSMGTTSGGYDLFQSWAIQANGWTSIPVGGQGVIGLKSLYLNTDQSGDTFNGTSLTMYLVTSPVTVSNPAPTGVQTIQLFSPAANYVYFFFQKNAITQTGLNGESQPNQENAAIALNTAKMVRAWNRMCERAEVIRTYLEDNSTTYPDFERPYPDYITVINTYGI